jgi:Ferredoxin thioredoxin reductase variable alpha chain
VRVATKPLILYHLATSRNQPCDVHGMEGVVQKVIDEVAGSPITATKPVVVKFADPKFIGHFDDSELEPTE